MMSITVTYTGLQPKEKDTTINEIRTQLMNDISWGSGNSNFHAIKRLDQSASWEKYRPKCQLISEMDPSMFKLEFEDDHFNFESEGVNHFIGTIAGDILINTKIGSIEVSDFRFTSKPSYFPGPRLGIDGVYKLFGNPERPLLAYSIKPRMGYTTKLFKKMFKEAAKGGADIIEDDERIIDPKYCRFNERVDIAEKLQKKYNMTLYSANITGPLDKMKERIDYAAAHGIKFVKIDVLVTGFDALRDCTCYIRDKKYEIGITVYPDVVGAYRNLSRQFILKMARLCGADIIYAGSPHWSRNSPFSDDLMCDCEKVFMRHKELQASDGDMEGVKPTLATMSNDISAQSAEVITLIFNQCFNQRQFAFFIGHGISASTRGVIKETSDISQRITKAARYTGEEYEMDPISTASGEDFSHYDISRCIEKYRKGY